MHSLRAPILDSPPLARYGLPQLVYGDAPAAGAHFTLAIGGRFMTRLLSMFVRLVTDANVAERTVLVEYRNAAGQRFEVSGAAVTQSASSTNDWSFDARQPVAEWPVDDTILVPLRPVLLQPTMDVRVFVDNIQATDQLSLVRYEIEQFYTTDQPSGTPPHSGV